MAAIDHNFYMEKALLEASKAFEINEVPIGCVIVYDDKIIGSGYNRRTIDKNVLHHGEILAINQACQYINDWRLEDCTLYVTLEPCPMCAGAIVQARIPTVVYGAHSPKAGAAGSVLNILQAPSLNHQVQIIPGVLEETCQKLMTDFFAQLRKA